MTVVVATTLAAYVTDSVETSEAWLMNAHEIGNSVDEMVLLFAALELDARGLEPFQPLLERMGDLWSGNSNIEMDYWTFSFDDHATEITTQNRLRRICMGQNMTSEYAMSVGASHLLFCAADCCPPPDVLPKLLEMEWPLCAPETPTYCLSGPTVQKVTRTDDLASGKGVVVQDLYPFPVEEHMASAACVLLGREVFRQLRWRVDQDEGMTDDPCLHRDAIEYLGVHTYVRKDIFAKHYPETIGPVETRGHDMRRYR